MHGSPRFPNINFPNTDFPNIGFPDIDFPNIDFPDIDFPNIEERLNRFVLAMGVSPERRVGSS